MSLRSCTISYLELANLKLSMICAIEVLVF
jgi:hypothetical protein